MNLVHLRQDRKLVQVLSALPPAVCCAAIKQSVVTINYGAVKPQELLRCWPWSASEKVNNDGGNETYEAVEYLWVIGAAMDDKWRFRLSDDLWMTTSFGELVSFLFSSAEARVSACLN